MFLRIDQGRHSRIIECEAIEIIPHEGSKNAFYIETTPGNPFVRYLIEKGDAEPVGVYLMNNDGKTIDVIFRKEDGDANRCGFDATTLIEETSKAGAQTAPKDTRTSRQIIEDIREATTRS